MKEVEEAEENESEGRTEKVKGSQGEGRNSMCSSISSGDMFEGGEEVKAAGGVNKKEKVSAFEEEWEGKKWINK